MGSPETASALRLCNVEAGSECKQWHLAQPPDGTRTMSCSPGQVVKEQSYQKEYPVFIEHLLTKCQVCSQSPCSLCQYCYHPHFRDEEAAPWKVLLTCPCSFGQAVVGMGICAHAVFWSRRLFIKHLWNASFKNLSLKRMDVSSFEVDLISLQRVDSFIYVCCLTCIWGFFFFFYLSVFLKMGSLEEQISISWECIRNANSQTWPWVCWVRIWGWNLSSPLCFNKSSKWVLCFLSLETTSPHWSQHTSRSLLLEIQGWMFQVEGGPEHHLPKLVLCDVSGC